MVPLDDKHREERKVHSCVKNCFKQVNIYLNLLQIYSFIEQIIENLLCARHDAGCWRYNSIKIAIQDSNPLGLPVQWVTNMQRNFLKFQTGVSAIFGSL